MTGLANWHTTSSRPWKWFKEWPVAPGLTAGCEGSDEARTCLGGDGNEDVEP